MGCYSFWLNVMSKVVSFTWYFFALAVCQIYHSLIYNIIIILSIQPHVDIIDKHCVYYYTSAILRDINHCFVKQSFFHIFSFWSKIAVWLLTLNINVKLYRSILKRPNCMCFWCDWRYTENSYFRAVKYLSSLKYNRI